ncbi:MAG: hypothetical protein OCC49_09380 [Fibrobacterales bacterium]
MFFNSLDFAIFLPIIFVLYWFVFNKNLKQQNCLVLVASYLFYGWWDWRFLSLILFSTIVDYTVGLKLSTTQQPSKRKTLLWISIITNLGFLGFFKYYNFFLDNFISAFTFMGYDIQASSLNIILPVGISFYTFQTLSYTIDIYRQKLKPTKDFIAFSTFVSFFPQLVAGPIERASNLLPQFYKKRSFDYFNATDGLRQILWGLFKKIVIADNCAEFANLIFNNSNDYNGSTLILGAIFFSFQIYGDFSGYSDIAIGTSRLFGFTLMRNFAYPYFSRDIAEFWRRWHISLSTWFRDYLYIPLGGSHGTASKRVKNVFIIFIVSGFWHGANWTFIAWGGLNALFFLPLLLLNKNRQNFDIVAKDKTIPSFYELWQMLSTFSMVVLAWIFFRADNIEHAINYINTIFSLSTFSIPDINVKKQALKILLFVGVFTIFEWNGRAHQYAIESFGSKKPRFFRWTFYFITIFLILFYGAQEQQFIYFQF